jgi:hypothetical protein
LRDFETCALEPEKGHRTNGSQEVDLSSPKPYYELEGHFAAVLLYALEPHWQKNVFGTE